MANSHQMDLERLFPLYLRMSDTGIILESSPKMRNEVSADLPGNSFFSAFKVMRPRLSGEQISLKSLTDQLILFTTHDGRLAMRAQLLARQEAEDDFLLLITPWMTWMLEHYPDTPLRRDLFPALDAQIELQIHLSSHQMMMKDTQKLLAELRSANSIAKAASAAKLQFINHVSHELRTPLNGISSALELIDQKEMAESSIALIDIMQKSAAGLLTLVNQILDYSQSTDGADPVTYSAFEPRQLCQEVMEILTVEAFCKNVRIVLDNEPEQISLISDTVKIRNVLLSAVSQSLNLCQGDRITIRYDILTGQDGSTAKLVFKVTESGAGWGQMSQDSDQGTAVALSTLRLLGGELIPATNQKGNRIGSIITIPVTSQIGYEASVLSAADQDVAKHDCILLVDDNKINLKLASMQLESMGLVVETAHDGAMALKMCQSKTYCMILMDIQMPNMDGMATTRLLRKIPAYYSVPVVAWTANASEEEQKLFDDAGFNDIIYKPTSLDSLGRLVRRWMPQISA
jgi:two-component system, sensor histidine kinase